MRRCLLALLFVALPLFASSLLRADAPSLTAAVVARGPLAGTRLYVSSDGLVLPAHNAATGARGRVGTPDGGHTWLYQDAGGETVEVVALASVAAHAQQLSGAVSRLRAGMMAHVQGAALRELAGDARKELALAKEGWLAKAGEAPAKPEVQQALGDLDAAVDTLDQVLQNGDAARVAEILPRLHAAAAVALAEPRDDVTVTITPATLDFGDVPVGASAVQSIRISTNSAASTDVVIDASGLAAPFTSSPPGGTATPSKNLPDTIGVTFAPQAEGQFSGQVVFQHPALPNGRMVVQVKGKGTPAKLIVTPSPIDFGKVHVKSFKSQPLTVKNNATVTVDVKVSLDLRKPFSHSAIGDINGTYPAGKPETMNVSFSPKKPGKYSGSVTLTSSATPGVTYKVTVIGEGVGDFTSGPSDVDFGTVNVGTSATKQISVTNNTDQPLTVALKLDGGPFKLDAESVTVPANGVSTINGTFTPTAAGAEATHVTVSGAGPNGKLSERIFLHGIGRKLPLTGLTLSKENVAFGVVPKRTQGTQSFDITNTTKAAKTVTLDTSGLHAEFFTVQGGNSFTIPPGGKHTVTITFFATGVCTHKGKIVVQSDGGSEDVAVSASAK